MKRARKFLPTKTAWKVLGYGVLLAAWVFAVLIAFQFLTVLGFYLVLGKETALKPLWVTISTATFYVLSALFIVFVTPKLARKWGFLKSNRKKLGLEGLPTWTDLGLGVVGFAISLVLAAIIIGIFKIFPWFNIEEQKLIYSTGILGIDRIIAFLMLVVVAPIVEEIIFRGWLYQKLKIKLPVPASIFITSLTFAALHAPLSASLNVFAMSVVACCLRELTGTIYASIIMHIIKNGLAFFLVFVFKM